MNQFFQTRLKLTLWYTLVLMTISIGLSSLYFAGTTQILDLQYDRLGELLGGEPSALQGPRRLQQVRWFLPPNHQEILTSELNEVRLELRNRIFVINVIILFLGAGASYFLSGKTLEPIIHTLELQKQFVADAAHELKTPLTALHTSLEVNLMDESLGKNAKNVLDDNLNDVKRLESLTTRLLKLAQAENNGEQTYWEPVQLQEFVESAIKRVKPLANHKKISIKFHCSSGSSNTQILGDKESLTEMVTILLDNAIKFSKQNSTVKLNLLKSKKMIEVEVVDHGIGIDEKDLDHIFDRFYRSDASRQRTQNDQEMSHSSSGSYGLGLALAKQIANNHGGKISVESIVGRGSVFKVKLNSIDKNSSN